MRDGNWTIGQSPLWPTADKKSLIPVLCESALFVLVLRPVYAGRAHFRASHDASPILVWESYSYYGRIPIDTHPHSAHQPGLFQPTATSMPGTPHNRAAFIRDILVGGHWSGVAPYLQNVQCLLVRQRKHRHVLDLFVKRCLVLCRSETVSACDAMRKRARLIILHTPYRQETKAML